MVGNSQLAFPPDSPRVEFQLVTRKEGNQGQVVLGNRYVLGWDKRQQILGKKIYGASIFVVAIYFFLKEWHHANSNFVPLLGLSIITLQMITQVYL